MSKASQTAEQVVRLLDEALDAIEQAVAERAQGARARRGEGE